jgi:hypothetical protein
MQSKQISIIAQLILELVIRFKLLQGTRITID